MHSLERKHKQQWLYFKINSKFCNVVVLCSVYAQFSKAN